MGGCGSSSQSKVGAYVDGFGDVHFEVLGKAGDKVTFEFRKKPTGGGWTRVSSLGGRSSLPSDFRAGVWRTDGGWPRGSHGYDLHVTINGKTVVTDEKTALACGALSKQVESVTSERNAAAPNRVKLVNGKMLEKLLEKPVLAWNAADLHAGDLFVAKGAELKREEEELKRRAQQLKREAQELQRRSQDVQRQLQSVQAEEEAWRLRELRFQELLELRQQAVKGTACEFWFLKADKLRDCTGLETLPAFQELRQLHPDWLERRSVSIKDAIHGSLVSEALVVSHRWETPDRPDPSGVQLQALQSHLNASEGEGVKLVWYDYCCLPQGKARTDDQDKELKHALPNVYLLFLSGSVLLLADIDYISRFWTQFEAWLSMQSCIETGLKGSGDSSIRYTITPIRTAPANIAATLSELWAHKSPDEALAILKKPDAMVTKQSDKSTQLEKISSLNESISQEWKVCFSKVAAS